MIKIKQTCICNHCLKTCVDEHINDKTDWFHFRRTLDDDSMDLTNSVDFCPDCAKLLASELRKYMSNVDYGHLDKTELEIQNLYKDLYLNIYALVLKYIIDGGQHLLDFIDAIPGKVTFSSVHKPGVVDCEICFNKVMVYIQQNNIATNLRTDWNYLSIETNAVTVHRLLTFLSAIESPVSFSLFDNVYPKESNATTIEYLLGCIAKLEECGSRELCSVNVSYICTNIICLIRHTVNLIREK